MAAARAGLDGGEPLERALGCCYRHLGRRDHSTAQLRARLLRAGFDGVTAEQALAEVTEQGYLDDARYARALVEDRRRLGGWGSDRIREALRRAGIARELIDEAVADGGDARSELGAATALLARRFATPPADDRERQRAFALLVRMGYDADLAYDAIRALDAAA